MTATSPEIARSFHAQRFRYWKNVKHNDPTAWFWPSIQLNRCWEWGEIKPSFHVFAWKCNLKKEGLLCSERLKNFAQFSPLQSFVITRVHPDGQIDICGRGISSRSSTFWCWSRMSNKSQGKVTPKIIKLLEFSPQQLTLSLASSRSHENETISRLRARLHGAGEPHEGEVNRLRRVTRLHDRWGDNMRDYVDRQVTPPRRVTSPACGHPPPRKQALKAWENNWYFPTPTKVSPQNDVCGQKWEWGQKVHTADDESPPWSRWCFWSAEASFPRAMTKQRHHTDLGSARYQYGIPALIRQTVNSSGNQLWRREMSAVFLG